MKSNIRVRPSVRSQAEQSPSYLRRVGSRRRRRRKKSGKAKDKEDGESRRRRSATPTNGCIFGREKLCKRNIPNGKLPRSTNALLDGQPKRGDALPLPSVPSPTRPESSRYRKRSPNWAACNARSPLKARRHSTTASMSATHAMLRRRARRA